MESLERVRPIVAEEWVGIACNLAPMVDGLFQADLEAGRPRDQRLRVGLYSYIHCMQTPDTGAPSVQPFAKESQSPLDPIFLRARARLFPSGAFMVALLAAGCGGGVDTGGIGVPADGAFVFTK
jgi:hypothetical protein